MSVRRWIILSLAAVLATASGCGSGNPLALNEGDVLEPPEAPTDTSGFVPETTMQ